MPGSVDYAPMADGRRRLLRYVSWISAACSNCRPNLPLPIEAPSLYPGPGSTSRARFRVSGLAKVLLGQRDPIRGAYWQNVIIEDVLRMVHHRRVAVPEQAVRSLFLLQHEREVLTA